MTRYMEVEVVRDIDTLSIDFSGPRTHRFTRNGSRSSHEDPLRIEASMAADANVPVVNLERCRGQ